MTVYNGKSNKNNTAKDCYHFVFPCWDRLSILKSLNKDDGRDILKMHNIINSRLSFMFSNFIWREMKSWLLNFVNIKGRSCYFTTLRITDSHSYMLQHNKCVVMNIFPILHLHGGSLITISPCWLHPHCLLFPKRQNILKLGYDYSTF